MDDGRDAVPPNGHPRVFRHLRDEQGVQPAEGDRSILRSGERAASLKTDDNRRLTRRRGNGRPFGRQDEKRSGSHVPAERHHVEVPDRPFGQRAHDGGLSGKDERIAEPGPLLEVVTRQYYEIRELDAVDRPEPADAER